MSNENLLIYENLKDVPATAQKPIQGGRLKGMTDINPMWRIKALTEQFGPVGFGWYYDILKEWLEPVANGEVACFVKIKLYVKYKDEWSKGIEGIGGNMFVAKESSGLRTSDECFKMALTDAISVSAKALGGGANVYWQGDKTKYDTPEAEDKDVKTKLRDYLLFICEGDETRLPKAIEHYTKFTGTDGKEVAGVQSIDKLDGKRLQATYGKVKAEYIKRGGKV